MKLLILLNLLRNKEKEELVVLTLVIVIEYTHQLCIKIFKILKTLK